MNWHSSGDRTPESRKVPLTWGTSVQMIGGRHSCLGKQPGANAQTFRSYLHRSYSRFAVSFGLRGEHQASAMAILVGQLVQCLFI
jgi:hypothetical protein